MSLQPLQQTSDSLPTHPVITFGVNLELNLTEELGPKTNLVNPHVYHPDHSQSDQDNARTLKAVRRDSRNLWLPNLLNSNLGASPSGIDGLRHGDTFQVKGERARYLRDTYTNGTVGDATSTPLWIVSEDS
tara:strand:+ start:4133 stop:4525 length:393 start_codon:yes stop_codon:yes gene_type:complete